MTVIRIFRMTILFVIICFFPLNLTAQTDIEFNDTIVTNFISDSLKGNLLGDSASQPVQIFLPPSYFKTDKKYPVVYFLPGYGEGADHLNIVVSCYKKLLREEGIKEFILVGASGTNKYGGSFYVNSPVSGKWEDYIVKDLVQYMDTHYRTLTDSVSRGIAGFSMGGFGALNLAFRNPDKFSSVCGLCPGLMDSNGLKSAMASWNFGPVKEAYGAAFAPNAGKVIPMWDTPRFDNSKEDQAVIQKWENGYGNLEGKIKDYLLKKKPLKAVLIGYGKLDTFRWLNQGTVYFSELLKKNKINYELVSFDGGHEMNIDFLLENMLPFFSNSLVFE